MRRYTMVPCLSIFASGRGAVGSFWRYWWFPFAIDLLLTGIGRLSGCRRGLWLLPFTVRRLFGGACISQSSSSFALELLLVMAIYIHYIIILHIYIYIYVCIYIYICFLCIS